VARTGAEADVFIGAGYLAEAVDGDWVEVEITDAGDGGERLPRGRIVGRREEEAAERVGLFRHRGRHGSVTMDGGLVHLDEPPDDPVRDGDLVVVSLSSSDHPGPAVRGRVTRVLGDPDDPENDITTITVGHQIPVDGDAQADAVAADLVAHADMDRAAELSRRRDLRQLTVLTIDPVEARDCDDAVSLEALPTGEQRLGVHIADVAHYVPRGGEIDRQARHRGTSVYLLDHVVHMLPAALASRVSTLAPEEDRLAVSTFLDIDGGGRVVDRSFFLSVIRSDARLTYEEAQAAIDGTPGAGSATPHAELLSEMADLSQRLRARRLDRGAIDFDLSEATVEMGSDGIPVGLGTALRQPSHQLVEEFMLAANEAVAEESAEREIPVLYRVHDPPDPDKLELFRTLAGSLGQRLPPSKEVRSAQLQRTLEAMEGRRDFPLLSQLLLRAMMRARYAPSSSTGHFGLASDRYLHFTSPIRRYPDLVVHRALRARLVGTEEHGEEEQEDLEWLGEWTSHCERRAEAAEREYVRLKQLRFMVEHVGEAFDGVVSGVVGAGFFVQLENWLVEGFCPLRLLEDDYYEFDEARHRLRGRHTGVVYAMGAGVRVRVVSVEPSLRRMDVVVIEGGGPQEGAARQGKRGEVRAGGRGDRRASARDARQGRRAAKKGAGGSSGGRRGRRRRR
jgi:ribonuclease R